MAQIFDVCIRGSGIVGRTLALLLARERLRVALVDQTNAVAASTKDMRAYALNSNSQQLLQSLRAWPDATQTTAVQHMEVHGDTNGCVHFDAAAQGVASLAWIVDVSALEQRLMDVLHYQPQIELVEHPVAAPLTVICEGRTSATRTELGVNFAITPYNQSAIATRLRCEHAHGQIARQWFTQGSILAFLPIDGAQGHNVAVVWSVAQSQTGHWLNASDEELVDTLQHISQGSLGQLNVIGSRAAWPLQQAIAQRWCGAMPDKRDSFVPCSWVLAGDAAHTVHPLAGQGLNLGLADAQALARILQTRGDWRSIADAKLLRRYERERKAALAPLCLTMDGLQQLFSRPEAPFQTLRNWGLRGFERSGLLKDWVARRAMGLSL